MKIDADAAPFQMSLEQVEELMREVRAELAPGCAEEIEIRTRDQIRAHLDNSPEMVAIFRAMTPEFFKIAYKAWMVTIFSATPDAEPATARCPLREGLTRGEVLDLAAHVIDPSRIKRPAFLDARAS